MAQHCHDSVGIGETFIWQLEQILSGKQSNAVLVVRHAESGKGGGCPPPPPSGGMCANTTPPMPLNLGCTQWTRALRAVAARSCGTVCVWKRGCSKNDLYMDERISMRS